MRLVSRLLFSHVAPLLVLAAALAIVLLAIGRMTQLTRQLGDDELGTLAREGSLHEADWNLDLAMRRAVSLCASGDEDLASREIARRGDELRQRFASVGTVASGLQQLSLRYLSLADRMVAEGPCGDHAIAAEAERTELDASITTIWVERLHELHGAARAQEADVGRLGTSALIAGVLVAALAFLLALWTARRMAVEISAPLAEISRAARRLSRGNFGVATAADGPIEIVELAEELERARVRLAELETLKQGFLASVSHELRTPLSKIREALALLSDGACGPLQERQARVVGIARTACEREIRIVTTLLDLSRLRAGTPLRKAAGASVDDALASAIAEEELDARARKITLDVSRVGDATRTSLDVALLERAFANLVRNAVAVSKPGQTVRITRRVDVDAAGKVLATVRVCDEGPGVPDDVRETLFEPFVTQEVNASPKALGIGLGLALAREVARAHGGELELTSGANESACFELRLPLEPARRPSARPIAQTAAVSA